MTSLLLVKLLFIVMWFSRFGCLSCSGFVSCILCLVPLCLSLSLSLSFLSLSLSLSSSLSLSLSLSWSLLFS